MIKSSILKKTLYQKRFIKKHHIKKLYHIKKIYHKNALKPVIITNATLKKPPFRKLIKETIAFSKFNPINLLNSSIFHLSSLPQHISSMIRPSSL